MQFFHVLALGILLTVTSSAQAKLYKWVDENGKTHYSDKIPPKEQKRAHKQLNQRGVVINSKDATKTPEAIAREKELERLRAQQSLILERQQAADRVLLRTFRSEDDLILTRDGKLTTIDQQIRVSRDNIKRLKQNLNQKQAYAAKRERQGKKVSKKIIADIENTGQQIQDIYTSIINKERNKNLIDTKFNGDLERFRQLKRLQNKQLRKLDTGSTEKKIQTALVETTLVCENDQHCNELWKKARAYGLKYTNTRIQTDSNQLFISAPAKRDLETSITVSRIRTSKDSPEIIFFDIQCKDNDAGKALCESDNAKKIRAGFRNIAK